MTNTAELLDAVVAVLRDLPDFARALTGDGDEPSIYAYPAGFSGIPRSLQEAVDAMPTPSAMVACRGMQLGARGGIPQFQFLISVLLRAESEADQGPGSPGYFTLLNLITSGEPASSGGARFTDATIHPDFDPPEQISFTPLTDTNGTEYWSLNFALTCVGG